MIELNNISKSYKSRKVLDNVSLSIADGEICGLMGINGAGKSTLMKIICNLAQADDGQVLTNGKPKTDNNGFGVMIEAPAFYPQMNGFDNLYAFSFLFDNVTKQQIQDALFAVGLKGVTQLYKNYSMGMKQRLYFAFATMSDPQTLILDEPFNGIDPISIVLLRNLIKVRARNGASVLVSGHSVEQMKELCDSICLLDNSKIIYHNADVKSIDLEKEILARFNAVGDVQ
ncbi:MAG: ATP-binding cassette domain-containing protein [Clostridia bacterium]